MAVLNILGFGCAAAAVSVCFEVSLLSALPVVWCALMLLLQGLAYVGQLQLIDLISVLSVAVSAWLICRKGKLCLSWKEAFLITLTFGGCWLLNRGCRVVWIDDLNYWASSVQSLFVRGGVESLHTHVATNYGDYPLGSQLLQWWILRCTGGVWRENWLYIGLSIVICSFVLPLFRRKAEDGRFSILWFVLSLILTVLFPHFVFITAGALSPDLLMAVVFGSCILAAWREAQGEHRRFEQLSIALHLAALVMIKSVGIFWALSALAFWLAVRRKISGSTIIILIPAIAACAAWNIACEQLGRTTYLVDAVTQHSLRFDREHLLRAKAFIKAVLFTPMVYNAPFSLPFSVRYLATTAGCLAVGLFCEVNNQRLRRAVLACCATAAVYLAVLLYGMLTMFYAENHVTAEGAMDLIIRYTAPLLAAQMMLWAELILHSRIKTCKHRAMPAFALAMYLLCLNSESLSAQTYCLTAPDAAELVERAAYEQQFEPLNQQISSMADAHESRVIYCSAALDDWSQCYLNYLTQGVSVIGAKHVLPEEWTWYIDHFHATHIFIQSNPALDPSCYQARMPEGEDFSFDTLYGVQKAPDGQYSLIPLT